MVRETHLRLGEEVMEVAEEIGGQALERVVAGDEDDAVLPGLALHRHLSWRLCPLRIASTAPVARACVLASEPALERPPFKDGGTDMNGVAHAS